jgi:hypothetical protein
MSAGGSVIINGSAGWVKGVPGNTVYAGPSQRYTEFWWDKPDKSPPFLAKARYTLSVIALQPKVKL